MIRLLSGDARDVLPTLPADSVQCVVTSPPYYGLRDYQTGTWGGGDAACDHREVQAQNRDGRETPGGRGGTFPTSERGYRDTCGKCGAVRVDRQIGLEATPDEYLATMVQVFREVRRVMRNDAVAFINLGDSYSDKQLLLMPARLALALQQDGWWVRSAIVWAKPNPMPESVSDRPTSAYEMVYLLSRSAKYYYDANAVREEAEYGYQSNHSAWVSGGLNGDGHRSGGCGNAERNPSSGRNLRNVWTIATHAYPNAHFATFPPELAERCIKAGTSERGACSVCGKPWVRVTERQATTYDGRARPSPSHSGELHRRDCDAMQRGIAYTATTTGWSPGCQCGITETRPCVVLDPFAGAGTTLLVADRLQRDAIGIELNTAYTEMAMERCRQDAPLFTSFPPAEPPEDERMADLFTDMAAD